MDFEVGEEVEVSVEDLKESWYAAKVTGHLDRDGDKKKILIEYMPEKAGLTPLRGCVDFNLVRPRPPLHQNYSNQLFQLNQQVDAFHGNGWWRGKIIRVVDQSRYIVYFRNSKGVKILEFEVKDLRAHQDWIGWRWVTPKDEVWSGGRWVNLQDHQGTKLVAQNEEDFQSPNTTSTSALWNDMVTPQTPRGLMEIKCEDILPNSRDVHGMMEDQATPNKVDWPPFAELSSPENMKQSYPKTTAGVLNPCKRKRVGEATEAPTDIETWHVRGTPIGSPIDAEFDLSFQTTNGNQNVLEAELCKDIDLPRTHVECQKEQPRVHLAEHMKESLFPGIEGVDNQTNNAMKGKRGQPKNSGTKDEAAKDDVTCVEIDDTQCLGPTLEEHQTLSLCLPRMQDTGENQVISHEASTRDTSMKQFNQSQFSNEVEISCSLEARADVSALQSPVDVTTNLYSSPMQEDERPLPPDNTSLPFKKRSDMWEVIDSMEIFQLMPQDPHFGPLETVNEEAREGIAMGHMLSFASLAERTIKARLDDPRSMFENKLKALSVLEDLGFTVDPIRYRLESLLKAKDSYRPLNENLAAAERELLDKINQFEEIEESITQLNIQLQALLTEKKMKHFKVAELEKTADEINQSIQGIRLDFGSVVASTAAMWLHP